MRRRRHTPNFTHGQLHFCIAMTGSLYLTLYCLPVTSTGYRPRTFVPSRLGVVGLNQLPDSAAQKFRHGFGARPDLEFFVDAADVGVDGFVADAQLVGDLFAVEPAGRGLAR